MPLLLLDLDNTLVDRDGAFRTSVVQFLATHGCPSADIDEVLRVDASGYAPRAQVADALLGCCRGIAVEAVHALLDRGGADHVSLAEPTREALRHAAAHGWSPVVVTNGRVRQQEAKLAVSGLDEEVAGWVVSEAVGTKKPAREIFAAAAATVGARLEDGGWMIGDSAEADIGGANGLGLNTVWLHHGRTWPVELPYRPTSVANDVAAALTYVVR